ncbi:MAG: Flp pilus assembly complex ATPase component TadA [Oligoflexia bacterium]|nr:Flp pilus assembly complex ATPase component TadA [Oligoflexia bacterium]
MAGFLSRIEKKKAPRAPDASAVLVRSERSTTAVGTQPQTQVVSSDASMASPDALLAELQAESKGKVKLATPDTRAAAQTTATERPASKKDAQYTRDSRKADLADDALPWWLTEPAMSSPQVDILVPASRVALNDFIVDNMGEPEMMEAIRKAVLVAAERLSAEVRFSQRDIQDAIQEVISLMLGKGPLQALYDDPLVTDIYMDGHNSIKCVRRGQALETPFRFRSPSEYESYITTMLQGVDRVLNLTSPIVDCVLSDKWRSRINAVHSSLIDGKESSLVIRVPRLQQISFYDLLRTKTLPATLAAWLAELVGCGEVNILVMGPTGSGKTTMTTALLSAVGSDERIVTIEDVPEIFVPSTHLEKLVSRPENSQGEGAVGMERLLRAALRRAPHRIVVGEIRDREGPLFLKALETGHAGSVATIHADNARDGLWRLLDVVQALETSPQESIQRRIARSLHVLITMKKINGRPCLMEVAEVRPPVGGEFVVKQIVRFDGEHAGKRQWRIATNQSRWMDRLRERGMDLQTGPNLLPLERAIDSRSDLEDR